MVKTLRCKKKAGGCGLDFNMKGRPGVYPSLCPGCRKKPKGSSAKTNTKTAA